MSDYLPLEVVVEILHRLPPKTLIRCTSVCKSWRSLITQPSFISDHLQRPSGGQYLLLQLYNENDKLDRNRIPSQRFHGNHCPAPVRYSLRHNDDRLTEFSTLDLPGSFEHKFCVVGICNGLVCITTGPECITLIVCNPCIRRYVSLPEPRDFPNDYDVCVGFGFDSRTNDYKVVRIARKMDEGMYWLCAQEVELYSLATGLWKSITAAAPLCLVCFEGVFAPHAFIDGIIHWVAQRWDEDKHDWYCFILSFDFGDEVFGEIVLPQSFAHVYLIDSITIIGGGKPLTVYHLCEWPRTCNIWVMKEYGVEDSWTKLFTLNWGEPYVEAPSLGIILTGVTYPPIVLCRRKSGEVLLLLYKAEKRWLYSLNAEKERFIDLKISGVTIWYLYSDYYAASLVLLDKASGLVSY